MSRSLPGLYEFRFNCVIFSRNYADIFNKLAYACWTTRKFSYKLAGFIHLKHFVKSMCTFKTRKLRVDPLLRVLICPKLAFIRPIVSVPFDRVVVFHDK